MFEFFTKGGFFMYPILVCSIVGLSIFIQKMWTLRDEKILPQAFLAQFYEFLSKGKFGEAMVVSRASDSTIGRIAAAALENSSKPEEELKEKIEEAGRKEASELGKYIEGLGAVSNVSTLLGLLGTIAGMIKIFKVISEQPIVNPPSLAGGISEALYTTAFGLLVAIPAYIAYKFALGRVDEIVEKVEEEAGKITDELGVALGAKGKSRDFVR
ncbi:MAG: MotA/TolQ/ExbB proton channel family protein [Deltaproteobacteria bacterium]